MKTEVLNMKQDRNRQLVNERIEQLRRDRKINRFWIIMISFWGIVLLFCLVLFGTSRVQGNSMYPTLADGNIIVFQRVLNSYKANDIVVYNRGDGQQYVKRIVAVEGDYVDIDDATGRLLVNGVPADEPYANGETFRGERVRYPVLLKEGEYFCLGDNRRNSRDSRDYGVIEEDMISGKVRCRIW